MASEIAQLNTQKQEQEENAKSLIEQVSPFLSFFFDCSPGRTFGRSDTKITITTTGSRVVS